MTHGIWSVAVLAMAACGGSGAGGADAGMGPDADVGDGGIEMPDAGPPNGGACGEGSVSEPDSYLPMTVGNTWQFRVDDFTGNPPIMKHQEFTEMITPDEETGPVIVQITMKATGITESWLQVQGDAVVRLRQRDFDTAGNLERTTNYLPSRLRLDESPEHLEKGASWVDNHVREVRDPLGNVTLTETVSDVWTVLDVGVPCPEPWSAAECLHVERIRTEGGKSQKQYWFARGYGKIREEGGNIEELLGCELQ